MTDGLNVFPINVEGHEDDYLMMVNEKICPKFGSAITASLPDFETSIKTLTDEIDPALEKFLGSTIDLMTAIDMCYYLSWADMSEVKLSIDLTASIIT